MILNPHVCFLMLVFSSTYIRSPVHIHTQYSTLHVRHPRYSYTHIHTNTNTQTHAKAVPVTHAFTHTHTHIQTQPKPTSTFSPLSHTPIMSKRPNKLSRVYTQLLSKDGAVLILRIHYTLDLYRTFYVFNNLRSLLVMNFYSIYR